MKLLANGLHFTGGSLASLINAITAQTRIGVETSIVESSASLCLSWLHESWQQATRDNQRDLIRAILLKMGCNIYNQSIIWLKPRCGFKILFKLGFGLSLHNDGRFMISSEMWK